ncbi:unnamed protein product [Lactuca virosa]|uniref:Uncharacterized protein n=1 Tax=Lactuca virosa TaxID=75947 RepID=A0AAU9NYW2_9ASTR|nr:unnamed protein product [Lactuca virosa]
MIPGEMVEPERKQPNVNHDWVLNFKQAVDVVFTAEPWTMPWTANTILQKADGQTRSFKASSEGVGHGWGRLCGAWFFVFIKPSRYRLFLSKG